MVLVHGEKIGLAEVEGGGGAAAVLAHIVGLIARAVAAVERRIEAFAHAALAREETVLHAVEVGEGAGLDHVRSEGASEKPTGAALLPSPTAKTRKRVPIWSGAIKRAIAASITARWASVARAFRAFARSAMPNRCRNTPCATGPKVGWPVA